METPAPTEPHSALADVEAQVRRRYARGAERPEAALCCPTVYEASYLENLPAEILEKDYGCGDPSRYVSAGETVVDLGSGSGKICYILSQRVGPAGSVIGVDFNDPMLALARKYCDEMAEKLGYRNVRFVKAKIQDLALDLEHLDRWLMDHPVTTVEQLSALDAECERLRRKQPLIPDGSVDVAVSNCVLNLVRPEDKKRLFGEIYRVLGRSGRAIISDIVCDEDPTTDILSDPTLWSGCIAGAFREDRFLQQFEAAGFYGIEVLSRQDEPWQVIDGVEFRSITVRAFKGKEGPCLERNQAVIYCGPWKSVRDDDGHTLRRGERMAVCDKTFHLLTNAGGPYAGQILAVPPRDEAPLQAAPPFDCRGSALRNPRGTQGQEYRVTHAGENGACGTDCC